MTVRNRGMEFLVYAVLGIVPKEIYDKYQEPYEEKYAAKSYNHYCIFKCAQRAYLDLSRTLERKDKESDNKAFSENVSSMIANAIYDEGEKPYTKNKEKAFELYNYENLGKEVEKHLEEVGCSRSTEPKEDKWKKCFHYGHFQKWINMTYKYMDVIGMLDSDEEENLDIPLDSYIMKAMSADKGIEFPNNKREKGKYSEASSVKWSRLTQAEYEAIVSAYREENLSIEWEHDAWITMAEKEKKIIK